MNKKGSATIEATISFSIFIILCVFFINIIISIGLHQELKSEADRIALEIAKLNYVLYILEPIENEDSIEKTVELDKIIYSLCSEIALDVLVNEMIDEKYKDKISKAGGRFIFTEEGKEIQIYIEYNLKLPLINKNEEAQMEIVSVARCWEGGDKGIDTYIWNLTPVMRGRRLEEIFKCNLPVSFFVLDYFNRNTGVGILQTSIDTTREYYVNPVNLKRRIMECIEQLKDFSGAKRGGVEIKASEILVKKLRIIIPMNDLTSEQSNMLETLREECYCSNIEWNLVKYGMKYIEE